MRKLTLKILAFILINTLFPLKLSAELAQLTALQIPSTPVDAAHGLNIKVSVGGTFIFQGTSKDNVGEPDDGLYTAVYVFDLKLEKALENNAKVVACFKGGRGDGLSQNVRTYANINAVSDPTLNGELELAKVTQLYYQQLCLNNKLTVSFGKLDFTTYFTGNKYSKDKNAQFITSIFIGDKIIEAPPQRIALNLCYALSDKVDLSYGYYTTKVEYIDGDGVNAFQVSYKPSKKGNYKLYIWRNNSIHYSCKNLNKKSGTYGLGISGDHEVCKNIGIFGRVSFKDPTVATVKKSTAIVQIGDIDIKPPLSWDVGMQIDGSLWSRESDALGFAVGQMYGSSDYKVKPGYKNGSETEFELYYRVSVNKHLGLTPAIQYFIQPRGGNVENTNNVFVIGIRTRFDF
ncbi:MAG: carbohydrate porin [Endomicrobium sp.]|jgi:carbohydrate-selective porin OprB|nr:carbohydrate porin [Endomicrobium sp.]